MFMAGGEPYPLAKVEAGWKEAVDAFLFVLLFVALGEEPAWRGWLLPWFRAHFSPLGAALAVAPIWALWHFPMWGKQLPLDQLGPFLVSLTAGSVVLAWLTNRTRGGVLPAMLCHASVNALGGGYLFTFVTGPEKTTLWWIYATLWALSAIVVVWLTRARLGDEAASDTAREASAVPESAPEKS
jgi:membrane protease YdiL (CAAX protease family)